MSRRASSTRAVKCSRVTPCLALSTAGGGRVLVRTRQVRVEVAIAADRAAIAERARLADATAVEDQGVGRSRPGRCGHRRAQLLLDDLRVIGLRNPDPVGHTQDVAVDGKPGNAERVSEHDIGRLPADPRQLDERVHRARHLAAVALDDFGRHAQ